MKKLFGVLSFLFVFANISSLNAQKANPESDFRYELETFKIQKGSLSDEVDAVVITEYIGKARNVIIPSSIEGFPVMALGKEVFQGTNVVSVVIPDSVISIYSRNTIGGDGCFQRCKFLQKVVLSKNITSIPYYCFSGCKALKTITLPEGITEIEFGAFCESGLESIDFPSSLRQIGFHAFSDTNLKTIKLVGGEDEKIYIDGYAFSECKALTSVTLSNVYFSREWVFGCCESLRIINIEGAVGINPKYAGRIFSELPQLPLAIQKKLKDLGLL